MNITQTLVSETAKQNTLKAHELRTKGFTVQQIANIIKVHRSTVEKYLRKELPQVTPPTVNVPNQTAQQSKELTRNVMSRRELKRTAPERKKLAFELRDQGKSVKEIADIIGISRVSVYKYFEGDNVKLAEEFHPVGDTSIQIQLLRIQLDAVTKERDLYRKMVLDSEK